MSGHSNSSSRIFCPLVIYHDDSSSQLKISRQTSQYNHLIHQHRLKTVEMLESNAIIWSKERNEYLEFSSLGASKPIDFEKQYSDQNSIDVSPSTSSSSSTISTSSVSTGSSHDSIPAMITSLSLSGLESSRSLPSPTSPMTKWQPFPESSFHSTMSMSVNPSSETINTKLQSPQLKPQEVMSMTNRYSTLSTDKEIAIKKRRRGNLPKEVTEFLKNWLIQHKKHPYPTEKEKLDMAYRTSLTVNQISNWFINARRRILQPMLESENIHVQHRISIPVYSDMSRQEVNRHQPSICYHSYTNSQSNNSSPWAFERTSLPTIENNRHYKHCSLSIR